MGKKITKEYLSELKFEEYIDSFEPYNQDKKTNKKFSKYVKRKEKDFTEQLADLEAESYKDYFEKDIQEVNDENSAKFIEVDRVIYGKKD